MACYATEDHKSKFRADCLIHLSHKNIMCITILCVSDSYV
jgi:hypothetical protein